MPWVRLMRQHLSGSPIRARRALRRSCRLAATVLLAAVVSRCARPAKPGQTPLSVTGGEATARVQSTMDSVTVLPVRPAASDGKPVRVIICHRSTVDTLHPPLYVIDGVVLGLRPDNTIDHAAARRAFGRINPTSIATIEVLKGEGAMQRFGPGAHEGAILITTAKPGSARREQKKP